MVASFLVLAREPGPARAALEAPRSEAPGELVPGERLVELARATAFGADGTGEASAARQVFGSALTVRLASSSGRALAFGRLSLTRDEALVCEADFDSAGTLRLVGLQRGCYELALAADSIPAGWLDEWGARTCELDGRAAPTRVQGRSVLARVELDGRADRECELRLMASATLCGRVCTSAGEGVPDLALALFLAPAEVEGRVVRTTSGPDGRFEWSGLPAGRACLAALHDPASGEACAPREVELLAAGTTRCELRLAAAAGRQAGRVVDLAGAPVAGVRVRATVEGLSLAAARTDERGRFELAGLPPRALTIEVHPLECVPRGRQGLRTLSRRLDAPTVTPALADSDSGEPVVLVVERAPCFTLEGRILGLDPHELRAARATAQPLRPGTRTPEGLCLSLAVDEHGGFVFLCEPSSRAFLIRVEHADGRRAESLEQPGIEQRVTRSFEL